jgi:hypothetical protein
MRRMPVVRRREFIYVIERRGREGPRGANTSPALRIRCPGIQSIVFASVSPYADNIKGKQTLNERFELGDVVVEDLDPGVG